MKNVTKLSQEERNKIIAERITVLRKSKKMTQSELAPKLNLSRDALANFETRTDRQIPFDRLIEIADYFNTSVDYLIGRIDIQNSNADIQYIGKETGLNDESIEILQELKKFSPEVIDTINYLIKQEKIFPISDFSFISNNNEDMEKNEKKALENYNKAEEYWDDLHLKILSTISNYYNVNIADEIIYIDKKNNIKSKDDFSTDFQRGINTKTKISLKDIADTKMLKDIEYQLKKSKENRIKGTTEKNKQMEKYLKECISVKIKGKKGADKK